MNKRSKSEDITDRAVANLLGAAELSIHLGYPLNRFLTVHCEKGGVQDRVHHFISRFTKQAGDWLRSRSTPWCCIWVLENPWPGGLNAHFAFHVPEQYQPDFKQRYRIWLRRSGLTLRKDVAKLKSVVGADPDDERNYIGGINGLLQYMLKGASKRARVAIDIQERIFEAPDERVAQKWRQPQGIIQGKRCGTSEAIGPKAQAEMELEIATRRRENPRYFRLRIVQRPIWPPDHPPKPRRTGTSDLKAPHGHRAAR